ncbi:MAG: hypothetical protein KF696_12505 [Planctomycetes bacterium]|nr:hypothetical protein [Planctomycetota bacterium]MCW8135911.1 hypothetical protein [Planctomycetota bacterium]
MRISRTSIGFVAVLLVAIGLVAGAAMGRAEVGAQAAVTPAAPLTAYVDFLSVLKQDHPLKKRQYEVAMELEEAVDAIDRQFMPMIEEQEKIKKDNPPDSRQYRTALSNQIELERKRYHQKLDLEQAAQQDLRNEGIDAFERIRRVVRDMATGMGYSQVINIVRDPKEVVGARDDFQMLQQQLLISPVLVFDEKHDITEKVLAKAKDLYDPGIAFGAETLTAADGKSIARNGNEEYEVRLGQQVNLAIAVTKKGQAATGKDGEINWVRTGIGTGELDVKTGVYKAPKEAPDSGDAFTVIARSVVDPTIEKRIKVKLLDADGKPLEKKK